MTINFGAVSIDAVAQKATSLKLQSDAALNPKPGEVAAECPKEGKNQYSSDSAQESTHHRPSRLHWTIHRGI